MGTLHDLTGQTHGRWTVLGRAPNRMSPSGQQRTYWACRCTCGEVREVLAGMLASGRSVSCGCHRAEVAGQPHPNRRKDVVGYFPAHRRIFRERGSANWHVCADCSGPAAEWSYDHADPDELFDDRGFPYSLKPDHYAPRCCPCHRAFDNGRSVDA